MIVVFTAITFHSFLIVVIVIITAMHSTIVIAHNHCLMITITFIRYIQITSLYLTSRYLITTIAIHEFNDHVVSLVILCVTMRVFFLG